MRSFGKFIAKIFGAVLLLFVVLAGVQLVNGGFTLWTDGAQREQESVAFLEKGLPALFSSGSTVASAITEKVGPYRSYEELSKLGRSVNAVGNKTFFTYVYRVTLQFERDKLPATVVVGTTNNGWVVRQINFDPPKQPS